MKKHTSYLTQIAYLIGLSVVWTPQITHANSAYRTYVIHTHGDPSLVQVVQNELSPAYGGSGGLATLYQDQLIIKATPSDYARILPLIKQLDVAPIPLTVFVSTQNQTSQHQSGGYIQGGMIHQSVWINGQYQNTSSQSSANNQYSIRTQSGSPAKISTDTLLGLTTYRLHQNRHQLWVNFGTSWVTLSDGFSATPRLLPNGQISLDIDVATRQSSSGTHRANTSITLYRGQWSKIGEIRTNTQSTTSYQNSSYQQTIPIWVKVE